MQHSQPADHSSPRDAAAAAAAAAAAEDARLSESANLKASDDEDYQGDNSDDNSGDANSSDDDTWNRVVTFAETPASRSSIHIHRGDEALSPPAALASLSRRPGHHYPRAVHRVPARRRHPNTAASEQASPSVRQRPHGFPGLSAAIGNPNVAKSHTDLERLRRDLQSTLHSENVSRNMPNDDAQGGQLEASAATHDQQNAASASYALDTPRPSPQRRFASSRLSTPGNSNVGDPKQGSYAFPPLALPRGSQAPPRLQRRHTLQYQASANSSRKNNITTATTTTTTSSVAGSGDELASPPSRQDASNSSGIEKLWFKRAHTFSVGDHIDAGAGMHRVNSAKSHDTVHTLPRILTMTSAREKDGGDMETGIDDLPALHFGREVTNDLRNIQLTFSVGQPKGNSRANPLKNLIRSKHNFRALVTYGGYLIPINVLLNVILLGRGWLQFKALDASGNPVTVNNPVGYLITSIISLVLIVVSGLCFVLRCLEYDVLTTTMISIVSNFVNAVLILASAIMYLKNERPAHPDANLTGEYYCSYAGAAVALVNALLLLLDILFTPGFRYRGSGMSRQQRMLQFNIILIVVWIGIGGYVWSKIESWDTITSVMFCMVTVTTIGFGNISPTKTYSRALQFIYGPLGILMFGLMLLNTRNVIIQITRNKFKSAKRGFEAKRKKLEQDMTANQVGRRLAARPAKHSWHSAFTDFLGKIFLPRGDRRRIGIPNWLRRNTDREDGNATSTNVDLEGGVRKPYDDNDDDNDGSGMDINRISGDALATAIQSHQSWDTMPRRQQQQQHNQRMDIPEPQGHEAGYLEATVEAPPHPVPRTYTATSRLSQAKAASSRPGVAGWMRRRIKFGRKRKQKASDGSQDDDSDGDNNGDADQFNETEDDDGNNDQEKPTGFKRVLSTASVIHNKVKSTAHKGLAKAKGRAKKKSGTRMITKQLWTALVLNLFFWCASAAIFYACESPDWSYFEALYFCYVAFTTIGYGDVVPKTTEGMIAFICLCFVAVALETFLVVSAVTFFSELLSGTMRQTRVQKRIEKRRRGLVAYEIRRHVKHPNYNPFGTGDEDRMVNVGMRKLKRSFVHVGEIFKGKRPVRDLFKLQRSADQKERDDQLTEGFIRHTTGVGGFAPNGWQVPSPLASPTHLPATDDLVPLSPSPSVLSRASESPGAATLLPKAASQQEISGSSDIVSVYSSTSVSPGR
ncbi:Potassium channel [Coemansia sp. RSA 2399]|nr:Potassium channel [Coemansia sp. RSA 2399]KAJ1903722.1 Potassium channel [Coemansia sp. IMI 209127]